MEAPSDIGPFATARRAEGFLRGLGVRATRQRVRVLGELMTENDDVTDQELYERFRSRRERLPPRPPRPSSARPATRWASSAAANSTPGSIAWPRRTASSPPTTASRWPGSAPAAAD